MFAPSVSTTILTQESVYDCELQRRVELNFRRIWQIHDWRRRAAARNASCFSLAKRSCRRPTSSSTLTYVGHTTFGSGRKIFLSKPCKKVYFDNFWSYERSKTPKTCLTHPFRTLIGNFSKIFCIVWRFLHLGKARQKNGGACTIFWTKGLGPSLNFDPVRPMPAACLLLPPTHTYTYVYTLLRTPDTYVSGVYKPRRFCCNNICLLSLWL
jgi:hypothetical protein